MRKIFESQIVNGHQVIVRGKNRDGEYVVKLYLNGKFVPMSDSYHTDKDDAIGTAKAVYEWARGKER